MVFGPEKVTTGAGNDIERATQMARRMVTRFGMSEVVGLMAVGDSDQEVFLGREIHQRRDVSEHTAQLVDQEVKRILDDAHQRARDVLEKEQPLLEGIAEALLERETLDRNDVELLAEGKRLPPQESAEVEAELSSPASGASEGTGGDGDAGPSGDDAGPAGEHEALDGPRKPTGEDPGEGPAPADAPEAAEAPVRRGPEAEAGTSRG
jgi:cell division protease FtsH